jgi:hypothetical protein
MNIVLMVDQREIGSAELTTDWVLKESFEFVNKRAIEIIVNERARPTNFAIKAWDGRVVKTGTITIADRPGDIIVIAPGDLRVDVEEDTPPGFRKPNSRGLNTKVRRPVG